MTEPNRPPASNQPPARPKARKRSAGLASLTGDAQFRQVRRGRTVRTPYFTLRAIDYRPRHGQPWKPMTVVGIVVPKKTLKRAVDRNRARRRVREAMRTLDLPPCRAILMPSPEVLTVDFETLRRTLAKSFDRAAP